MLRKVKLIAIAILSVLMIIVVLQNTEAVETKILFATLTMPRAALLFGALAVGFALGVIFGNRIAVRRSH